MRPCKVSQCLSQLLSYHPRLQFPLCARLPTDTIPQADRCFAAAVDIIAIGCEQGLDFVFTFAATAAASYALVIKSTDTIRPTNDHLDYPDYDDDDDNDDLCRCRRFHPVLSYGAP